MATRPLLDRIDIHVEVAAATYQELRGGGPSESSPDIRGRVEKARARVLQRADAFARDPERVRAGRVGRADARNGGAAKWGCRRGPRPDSQGRWDHHGSERIGG